MIWNEFCVVWRTWTKTINLSNFFFQNLSLCAVFQIQFCDSLDSDKHKKNSLIKGKARFEGKIYNRFLIDIVFGVGDVVT